MTMIKEELETLRDLEQDIIAAIGYDLETGSHRLNNTASDTFAKEHPELMKAINALSEWVNKQEEMYE